MERTINNNMTIERKLNNLSELVGRAKLAMAMGMSYGGKRNIYDALGYPQVILPVDYIYKYKRHDISHAVISKPVDKMWKGDVLILEADDSKTTKLEDAWQTLYNELLLKSIFVRADKLTGLSKYGVILLGFDDVDSVEKMTFAVTKSSTLKLVYAKPFSSNKATITKYDENPKSPRYSKPILYQIQIEDRIAITAHYTRVIHIIDEAMESDIEGSPRLEVVYNRMEDLEKITGGSGEMFWRGARPGYQGKIDENYDLGDVERADLEKQIDEYEHNLRRLFVNEGVDLKGLETQVADPTNHFNIQISAVSAVTNIPQRILLGSERGELASSQDADEWWSYLASRRANFAETQILRPFIDRLIEYGALPTPTAGVKEYSIKWEDLFAQSEEAKITIGGKRATALKDYASQAGAEAIVPPEAFLELFLGFNEEQVTLVSQMRDKWMKEEEKKIAEDERIAAEAEAKAKEEAINNPDEEEEEIELTEDDLNVPR
jgi:uncharacterized protein